MNVGYFAGMFGMARSEQIETGSLRSQDKVLFDRIKLLGELSLISDMLCYFYYLYARQILIYCQSDMFVEDKT